MARHFSSFLQARDPMQAASGMGGHPVRQGSTAIASARKITEKHIHSVRCAPVPLGTTNTKNQQYCQPA
jgi:hypothetical protein